MLHKAVSVFLLLIILGGFIPVASATEINNRIARIGDPCAADGYCRAPSTICTGSDDWGLGLCEPGCRTDEYIRIFGGESRCPPNHECQGDTLESHTGICERITGATPTPGTTPAESDDPCEGARTSLIQGMGNFLTGNLMWGAGFFAKDALVSLLEEKKYGVLRLVVYLSPLIKL